MSTDDVLSEQDEALLEAVDETGDDGHVDAMRAATTSHTRPEYARLRETVRELVRDINELQKEVDGREQSGDSDSKTVIGSYVAMKAAEREDLLDSSDRRAAVLLEHWWEMAKQAGNGAWVVTTHRNSTLKNNPSQAKIDLEKYCGEDLHWEEVYRAMRHLAKKSVADTDDVEVVRDEANRLHIVGGAFQYHERATPDGSDTYKLVELVDEDSLTVL